MLVSSGIRGDTGGHGRSSRSELTSCQETRSETEGHASSRRSPNSKSPGGNPVRVRVPAPAPRAVSVSAMTVDVPLHHTRVEQPALADRAARPSALQEGPEGRTDCPTPSRRAACDTRSRCTRSGTTGVRVLPGLIGLLRIGFLRAYVHPIDSDLCPDHEQRSRGCSPKRNNVCSYLTKNQRFGASTSNVPHPSIQGWQLAGRISSPSLPSATYTRAPMTCTACAIPAVSKLETILGFRGSVMSTTRKPLYPFATYA